MFAADPRLGNAFEKAEKALAELRGARSEEALVRAAEALERAANEIARIAYVNKHYRFCEEFSPCSNSNR